SGVNSVPTPPENQILHAHLQWYCRFALTFTCLSSHTSVAHECQNSTMVYTPPNREVRSGSFKSFPCCCVDRPSTNRKVHPAASLAVGIPIHKSRRSFRTPPSSR